MPELFQNKKSDGVSASNAVSPRMMDKFFSLVATIDDFEKHLDLITLYGDISVGKDVTSQLVNFINKKLDKLPSVEKLIKEYDLPTAKAQLTSCCGDFEKDSQNFKMATSAILTTRMYNYMIFNHKNTTKDEIRRFLELMLHTSFTNDQKYLLVYKTINLSNTFSQIVSGDPRTIKYITK